MPYDYPPPISIRLRDKTERTLIEAVAEWQGETLSTFARESILKEARNLLEKHGDVILTRHAERQARELEERRKETEEQVRELQASLREAASTSDRPTRPTVLARTRTRTRQD